MPTTFANKATSPDGTRVASIDTQYDQVLHIGEESMSATVSVVDRVSGETIHRQVFDYYRSKRFEETGHEFVSVAFDDDGTLLVGAKGDDHVERIALPPAGELSKFQVLERTRAALAAAYGDRAPLLADVVGALFWSDNAGTCRSCSPRERAARAYVCSECKALFQRRLSGEAQPPDVAMTLAETARALAAHAADPEQVLAMLSARASSIPAITTCTVCDHYPQPEPLDFWTTIGRVCADCVRRHAKK